MDLLARREHARAELAFKLEAKGVPEALAREVVEDLAARGLVDDRRYGEALVESRAERGYGPLYVLRELRMRGVDHDLSRELVDARRAEWAERAAYARCRHFGDALPEGAEARARQIRFLERKGFSRDHIKAALSGGEP
jgi:regulatory protein